MQLRRSVCVSFYPRKIFPKKEEILAAFQPFGKVKDVVSDSYRCDASFFVIFEKNAAALRCYKKKGILYDKYDYIVEVKGENDEIIRSERADPNSPSLIDLNDDCLLHLLDFLKNEKAIEFINAKFRRLYFSSFKKYRHISIDKNGVGLSLSRIYHASDHVTHLSISFAKDLPVYEVFDILFLCCRNLQNLKVDMDICNFGINLPKLLKEISSSVTEMDLCFVKENDIPAILRKTSLNLQKLSIEVGEVFYREIALTKKSLTALLIYESLIDIGQILRDFPQLQILACTMDRTSGPIPANHNLQDLFVNTFECHIEELAEIRESCKQLRHLRVVGKNILKFGLRRFLPVEGLRLKGQTIDEKSFNELALLKDELKILLLADCRMEDEEKYALMLSKFKKLEIILWDHRYHGDIDLFLKNRPANVPLKIIANFTPSEEQRMLSPSCEWFRNIKSLFGSFSIYKQTLVHSLRDEKFCVIFHDDF